ncbi:hypothetical protein HDU98_005759 [Podochytrium sp. JEL0797]|nr:hypothetical protein HDU98_005759 [Podochytrium sp. JEL0797]
MTSRQSLDDNAFLKMFKKNRRPSNVASSDLPVPRLRPQSATTESTKPHRQSFMDALKGSRKSKTDLKAGTTQLQSQQPLVVPVERTSVLRTPTPDLVANRERNQSDVNSIDSPCVAIVYDHSDPEQTPDFDWSAMAHGGRSTPDTIRSLSVSHVDSKVENYHMPEQDQPIPEQLPEVKIQQRPVRQFSYQSIYDSKASSTPSSLLTSDDEDARFNQISTPPLTLARSKDGHYTIRATTPAAELYLRRKSLTPEISDPVPEDAQPEDSHFKLKRSRGTIHNMNMLPMLTAMDEFDASMAGEGVVVVPKRMGDTGEMSRPFVQLLEIMCETASHIADYEDEEGGKSSYKGVESRSEKFIAIRPNKGLPMQRMAENPAKRAALHKFDRVKETFKRIKKRMSMPVVLGSSQYDGVARNGSVLGSRLRPVSEADSAAVQDSALAGSDTTGVSFEHSDLVSEIYPILSEHLSGPQVLVASPRQSTADFTSAQAPLSATSTVASSTRAHPPYKHFLAPRRYSFSSLFSEPPPAQRYSSDTPSIDSESKDCFWTDPTPHSLPASPITISLHSRFSSFGNTSPILLSNLPMTFASTANTYPVSESRVLLLETYCALMDELSEYSDSPHTTIVDRIQAQLNPSVLYLEFLLDLLEEFPKVVAREALDSPTSSSASTSIKSVESSFLDECRAATPCCSEDGSSISDFSPPSVDVFPVGIVEDGHVGFKVADVKEGVGRAGNARKIGKRKSFQEGMKELFQFLRNRSN